jgi:hemerythrin-like domain-containing protein
MRPLTLTIINDEHRALAAMLRSLPLLLDQARRAGRMPDFGVLRAMLFYIDEFPERLHHTKESQLLFPMLRARVPTLAEPLDRLDQEHAHGENAIRHLEHLLLAFEVMGESRREAFENAASRYVEFYLAHMGLEEQTILPAAQAHLTAEDWAELDLAFAANQDPLAGHGSMEQYRSVVQTILNNAPAPIGLG